MKKIVAKFINDVNELLAEKLIRVRLTEDAVTHLAEVGFDPKMGARPLSRKINDMIKVPLSKKILFGQVQPNTIITIDYIGGEFTFGNQIKRGQPMIDDNGYIVLE
jgi:ATP-dependent Clp protease ATP-binding subunit ClpA